MFHILFFVKKKEKRHAPHFDFSRFVVFECRLFCHAASPLFWQACAASSFFASSAAFGTSAFCAPFCSPFWCCKWNGRFFFIGQCVFSAFSFFEWAHHLAKQCVLFCAACACDSASAKLSRADFWKFSPHWKSTNKIVLPLTKWFFSKSALLRGRLVGSGESLVVRIAKKADKSKRICKANR